ncbi:MAG: hypothetical protein JNJ54_15560 [Myxococcaceae bacterium]|nr:hypothetical protein [Myxococcaceae bacterium]
MLAAVVVSLLAAGDAADVAALVKSGKTFAEKGDSTWTEQRYNAYSSEVSAWQKEAAAVQARPTLAKKDAIALLNVRALVADKYRVVLSTAPVPKSMELLGATAAWKDSIAKWQRSLAAESASLKEQAKQLAK